VPQVRLTTLPVIRRYSLATRQEWADAEVLLETLEESLKEVRRALGPERSKGRGGDVGWAVGRER
jgi:hypothetical protein